MFIFTAVMQAEADVAATSKKGQVWKNLKWPAVFIIIAWIIEALSQLTGSRPVWLGVLPHHLSGLHGIFTSPFIHGGIEHLVSNTLPLLILGTGLFYFYEELAWRVTAMIWLFTGFWIWLAAREVTHIGASGLVYGLVCFLFFSGILRKDPRLLSVSLLVAFLYGSLVWGVLPVDQTISWEAHLFGSFAGIFCAFIYRKHGPQRPKAQWEIDEEMELLEAARASEEEEKNISTNITINYDYVERKTATDSTEDENPRQ